MVSHGRRRLGVGLELGRRPCLQFLRLDLELDVELGRGAAGRRLDGATGAGCRERPFVSATQLNAAQAQASAAATAGVVQVVSQDAAEGGTRTAAQLTAVVQDAGAFADAQQADVGALAWRADHLDQSNLVGSAAVVALSGTIAQSIDQVVDVADRAVALQWGGQEADIAQAGRADAASSQRDAVLTGPGAHAAGSVASAAGTAAVDQQLFQDGVLGGGVLSQWAGQLVLVEQALDVDATVVQTGTRRSRLVGGTAGAFATAADLALIDQFAGQSATRVTGTGSQAILQAAYAAQDASAHGATTQQAGAAALPAALSEAEALNRAAMVQDAVQTSSASDALDVQDISQTSIVVQQADASSVSFGGIAGPAAVLDCGVTHQAAAQSIGPAATLPRTDPSPFCSPRRPPKARRPSPPRFRSRRAASRSRQERPSVRHGAGCSCGRRRGGNELRRRQSGRGRCPGAAPARRTDRRRALGAPPGAPRAGTVTHPRVFRPAPLHASAPRHAPAGAMRGQETPIGSRRFRRREIHHGGSPHSQQQHRLAQGPRGSQRSSRPSRSCRRFCSGREKGRPSGGRSTSSHR